MTYTTAFREYTQKSLGNTPKYMCVIISAPSITPFRLVKGIAEGGTFTVDGVDYFFEGSGFEAPELSQLQNDDTEKGTLSFNRVGYNVRAIEKQIGGLEKVTVRILTYLGNKTTTQSDFTYEAGSINYDESTVSIPLRATNYAKVAAAQQIYTAEEFPALENL